MAPQCAVCLEDILPAQTIKLSFCHPVQHVLHYDCWWDQTEEQQEQCCICRQPEVSRPTAHMIYRCFPKRGLLLTFAKLCGEPGLQWFSAAGQCLLEDFVRGDISKEELIRIPRAKRSRPHVENAINDFNATHALSTRGGATSSDGPVR